MENEAVENEIVEEQEVAEDEGQEAVEEQQETFPRVYVEQLRNENAKYRTRAQQADDYAHRLHKVLVERTGRLADPTDLPFDEAHLADEEALEAAISGLIESKPHLKARTVSGDIGQGVSVGADTVSLAGILRANAQ